MVGVPRSQGCALCVKRRVKCDEARPGCGNCRRYGVDCPGFDRHRKFVTGKHHVRARRLQKLPGELEWDLIQSEGLDDFTTVEPLAVQSARFLEELTDFSIPPGVTNLRTQYVYALVDNLFSVQSRLEIMYFAPWFTLVPQLIGQKSFLDDSISAFILHLLGKARQDTRVVSESRSMYGQSLRTLQKALNHSTEWRSQETLCATMTLCLFELFAGTVDSVSWMKHASGVTRLIEQRGPGEYETMFERALLLSFRPLIIMNSMFSGHDCFLAKRQWQKVFKDIFTSTVAASPENLIVHQIIPKEALDTVEGYFSNLAKIPSILRYGHEIRENKRHAMPIDQAQVVILLKQANATRIGMSEWFEEFSRAVPPPVEIPSEDPTSLYQDVLKFPNPWIGSLHLGYWASMLILQEVINQCQDKVDYTESNRLFANNIYRSLENVGAGVMGPFRVGYALRISYDFADLATQHWLRSLLDRFEKTYAATSADSYPPPAPNEHMFG